MNDVAIAIATAEQLLPTADALLSTADQPLRMHIDRVGAKLGGLEKQLRALDGQLADLAPRREQFGLVQNVCDSLDRLRDLGVASMFWGDYADGNEADQHVRQVREQLNAFTDRVNVIEQKRQVILDDIAQGRNILNILEGDLSEIEAEQEERRREWLIEREVGPLVDRPQRMPWLRVGEDEERFRRALMASLLVAFVAGALTPFIGLPLPEEEEVLDVPERIVRFIQLEESRALPPPIVAPTPEEPKPEEPEPVLANETPEAPPAEEPPAPAVPEETPRQRAEAAGILAFRESFATIAERRPAAQLGSQARIANNGAGDSRMPERALIASNAPGSSGGINLASFSRQVGGDGGGGGSLEGVDVGRVESSIRGAPSGTGSAAGDSGWVGAQAGRTDEEIQIVFDRYKASLYRLYNRELRNDPTLRGQMVLHLTIEPDGSVSMCELRSTDMDAPVLVEQVLARVRTFDFGAKDVAAVTIIYPIDFLPAA